MGALAMATALGGTTIAAAPAFAGGNGATSQTEHAHGTQTEGLVVVDFLPSDSPALPDGCWANPDLAIVSADGNAVEHSTFNKAGDFWFTSTYAGGAAVYPVAQPVAYDSHGDVIPDTSSDPLYVGHLTTWFGRNDNNRNGTFTATVSFHGTSTDGEAVNLTGFMHMAFNANGDLVVLNSGATC